MINTATKPHSLKWHFPLWWIAINTFVSPLAIFAGLVSTYVAAPWNTGPIDSQAYPDSISFLLIRSLAFAIVAGLILEVPRWLMLRTFLDSTLWIPVTIIGLAVAMFTIYNNQESTLSGDWMWPNCLANLSSELANLAPLVLPGILQSVILARKRQRWYFWLIAGSASYILPLAGFMACSSSGFLAGSLIAASITLIAIPITLKESYP